MTDDLEPGEIREEGRRGGPPVPSRLMTKGERKRARRAALQMESPQQRNERQRHEQRQRDQKKQRRKEKALRRAESWRKELEAKMVNEAQGLKSVAQIRAERNRDEQRRLLLAKRGKREEQAKLDQWRKSSFWIPMPGARVGFKDLAEETLAQIASYVGEWEGGGITGPLRDLHSMMRVSKATLLPAGKELYRGHAYLSFKVPLHRLLVGVDAAESSNETSHNPFGSSLKLQLLRAITEMDYVPRDVETIQEDVALLNRLPPDLHVLTLDKLKVNLLRGRANPDLIGALCPHVAVKRLCHEVDHDTPIQELRKPYTLRFAGQEPPEVVMSHSADLLRPIPVCHGARNVIDVLPSEIAELSLERRAELLVDMIETHRASAPGDLKVETTYELVNFGFSSPSDDDVEDLNSYDRGSAAASISDNEKSQTAKLAQLVFERLPDMEGKIKFEQAWDTSRDECFTAQCEVCEDEVGWSPEQLCF